MKAICIVTMLLVFAALSPAAGEPPNPLLPDRGLILDGRTLLAEISKLMERGDWQGSFELHNKHREYWNQPSGFESTGFKWTYFHDYLHSAALYSNISDRAKAAQTLKLYDLAMKQYDALLALADNAQLRYNAGYGKAMCAWGAAQIAVRRGGYDAAALYLDVMRDFGQTWIAAEGGKKGDLVRKLMAESNSVPVRIEFANGFWIANPAALGVGYAEARQILVDTLKLIVTPDQRLQLYQFIQQHSFAIPDTATAIGYTERICAEFAVRPDVCDQALFVLAKHYTAQGQPRKASETLQRILTLNPTSELAGTVHLGLSEVFASMKDEPQMLEHLELAAKMPPKDTRRNIMDASDSRQLAIVRLGEHYQGRKDFAKALEYFRAWQPRSWCGNGLAQFANERDLHIAQCLVNLGKDDEALSQNLMPHLRMDQGELYCNEGIPELVVRLYEDKKDLDELIQTIRPHAESKHNRAAQITLDLAEIRAERRDGNIEALVNRLRHSGQFVHNMVAQSDNKWQAPPAARALLEMKGKKDYLALRGQYDALLRQQDREKADGRPIWVLYAIALSQSPSAKELMKELRKEAESGNPRDTIGVGMDDIRFLNLVAEGCNLEPESAGDSQ